MHVAAAADCAATRSKKGRKRAHENDRNACTSKPDPTSRPNLHRSLGLRHYWDLAPVCEQFELIRPLAIARRCEMRRARLSSRAH
eukprot:6173452-Pleurochrysis_carterae.AAC.2